MESRSLKSHTKSTNYTEYNTITINGLKGVSTSKNQKETETINCLILLLKFSINRQSLKKNQNFRAPPEILKS